MQVWTSTSRRHVLQWTEQHHWNLHMQRSALLSRWLLNPRLQQSRSHPSIAFDVCRFHLISTDCQVDRTTENRFYFIARTSVSAQGSGPWIVFAIIGRSVQVNQIGVRVRLISWAARHEMASRSGMRRPRLHLRRAIEFLLQLLANLPTIQDDDLLLIISSLFFFPFKYTDSLIISLAREIESLYIVPPNFLLIFWKVVYKQSRRDEFRRSLIHHDFWFSRKLNKTADPWERLRAPRNLIIYRPIIKSLPYFIWLDSRDFPATVVVLNQERKREMARGPVL